MKPFRYYTTHENDNSRIFQPEMDIQLDPSVWKFHGFFDIDELPKHEFPVYVVDHNIVGYNLLSTTEKAVKVKSDCGLTFFVPKSMLFRNGKLNLSYFRMKASLERDRFVNRMRGLS